MARCFVSFDMGIKNLAYTIVSLPEQREQGLPRFTMHHWCVTDIRSSESTKVSEIAIEQLVRRFNDCYRENIQPLVEQFSDASFLIERQPCPTFRQRGNPKCLVLSHVLQSSLLAHGVPANHIHFVSPKLKLKLAWEIFPEVCREIKARYKTNYTVNKHISIDCALQVMQRQQSHRSADTHDHFCTVFTSSKKKDDLADVLLQALAFHMYG